MSFTLLLAACLTLDPVALDRLEPAPPVVGTALTPAERLLQKAQELRYAQRWFEAAAAYREFLTAHPGSDRVPLARFYLASVLERDQRWDEAARAFTEFLERHPDQRSLGKEARLGRIRCWGIRQGQAPAATPGLVAALSDSDPEVRVAAALELSRNQDRRAIPVLQEGITLTSFSDRCTMALIALGEKPTQATSRQESRFLVIRIQEQGKKQPVEIRLSIFFAKALGNYLSDEQLQQVRKKGVDVENLGDQLTRMPKGSLLFSATDRQSSVTVTVE